MRAWHFAIDSESIGVRESVLGCLKAGVGCGVVKNSSRGAGRVLEF